MNKPVTLLIDEYRKGFTDLMNNSGLPAWLLVMLTEPFISQLKQLAEMQAEEDRIKYESGVQADGDKDNNTSGT